MLSANSHSSGPALAPTALNSTLARTAHGSTQALRWLLVLLLASMSGCGGCRREDEKLTREELEKRAREQRDALDPPSSMLTLPADSQAKVSTVKPGHWYETRQQFKSNREDLQVVAVGDVARGPEPVKLPGTNALNEFCRRTSLPKGQTKTVELEMFIPDSGERSTDPFSQPPRIVLRSQLRSWPLLTPIQQSPSIQPTNELRPSEFQLIVLSPQALSYEFLTVLDAVYWKGEDDIDEPRTRSYFVSLVKPLEGKYAIPHSMLTMTATAVIVWDDVSVDELTSEQQTALIDWLHWGGQLIINGPNSWSRLQNSFLSPYLPANSADAAEFTTADFREISETWAVTDLSKPEKTPLDILGPPVSGLRFKLNEAGKWLPNTGELVAERQVGRGRVVLSSFTMREPRINRWKYFSSFLSTGLLRRPPRDVRPNSEGLRTQFWAGSLKSLTKDARLHSNFRILSRDLPLSANAVPVVPDAQQERLNLQAPIRQLANNEINGSLYEADGRPTVNDLESLRWGGNGASWNDYSGLSVQAVSALRKAAGIELPDRWTIIYLIIGYLVFLVPVNWIVFRILGRLEYAWLAAPVMALIGVGIVTRVAQLDIGFARRTTEISLLELHGDHTRGHLTRYVALYTSLSTNYQVEFPESGSVVLPLGDLSRSTLRAGQAVRNLRTNFGFSSGVQLEPVTVYSNSTEMLHAEQMVSVGSGVALRVGEDGQSYRLLNGTEMPLSGALILRNTGEALQYAWVGEIGAKSGEAVKFADGSLDAILGKWNETPATRLPSLAGEAPAEASDTLWIGGILGELLRKTPLVPGQSRLFAYTDARPGELKITPAEDQFDGRCVIVAHLTPAEFGPIRPDVTIWSRLGEVTENALNAELTDDESMLDQQ